jgi:hypothetical protein
VLVVFCVFFLIASFPTPAPETAADKAAKAAAKKTTSVLCNAESVCDEYAGARRACAVAGDYEKCMAIRLDAELTEKLPILCKPDGILNADAKTRLLKATNRTEWPSSWECLWLELKAKAGIK